MGVYDSRARAVKGLKELMGQWAETNRTWNDEVSRAFFKKYMEHLESDMRSASSAMDHMAQLVQQCKRDCE